MIANLGGPMAVLLPTTVLSAVPVVVALYRLHRRASFSPMRLGVRLLVISLIITLTVDVPIDVALGRWTVETLPTDWTIIRDRWQAHHTARAG